MTFKTFGRSTIVSSINKLTVSDDTYFTWVLWIMNESCNFLIKSHWDFKDCNIRRKHHEQHWSCTPIFFFWFYLWLTGVHCILKHNNNIAKLRQRFLSLKEELGKRKPLQYFNRTLNLTFKIDIRTYQNNKLKSYSN